MNYFNYFSEIESVFIRRRGRNLLLSPLDWELIETWQKRDVPLHIILRGIEKVFDAVDKQPARKKTIKSLTFCRDEIETQYAEWLESQIGKDSNLPVSDSNFQTADSTPDEEKSVGDEIFHDEVIAAHLDKVGEELKFAKIKVDGELSKTLNSVSNSLANLKVKFPDAETLENTLDSLDSLIDESLLEHHLTENLKTEVKKELASYRNKMDAEVYRRTFDLMLLKRLREQSAIPRLSLFNL